MLKRYRYPLQARLSVSVFPTLLTLVFLAVSVLDFAIGHLLSGFLFVLATMFFGAFVPGLLLSTAEIRVGENGISSYWCGLRTQSYSWADVLFVRRVKRQLIPNRNREYIEIVKDQKRENWPVKNAFGVVRVTDYVENYQLLISQLNDLAAANGVARRLAREADVRSATSVQARLEAAKGALVNEL